MLVSHRKKFIYLKTVKTASTSVESFFEPDCMPAGTWHLDVFRPETVSADGIVGYRGVKQRKWFGLRRRRWFDHMPAKLVKRQLPADVWDSYFKFCVIRNPFEKVVSAFHFFQWMETRGLHKMSVGPAVSEIERFRQWVAVDVGKKRTILDRACYTIGDEVCVDYFIRYENLQHDVDEVSKRLEIETGERELPNLVSRQRASQSPIAEYYDPATRKIVEQVFDFELRYFDYQFPTGSR